jgi:hypothetical protein
MNTELRVGEWECKVYCEKHRRTGRKFVKSLKECKQVKATGEVVMSDAEEQRRKTRF